MSFQVLTTDFIGFCCPFSKIRDWLSKQKKKEKRSDTREKKTINKQVNMKVLTWGWEMRGNSSLFFFSCLKAFNLSFFFVCVLIFGADCAKLAPICFSFSQKSVDR
ncbi:hypothetical protein, unlikely [Trypanosoma brucei gambiense DAL972]|uniref:Uncharacterized protein n=1 Tax=Trypanosoma brucei gambiense (strain MHOM/CI/86/DAL972) TaxID=679716 RepID=C9ZP71_TRYB9|nr:hypothetical protein, unlikely [Trypanosoma brucei gambiense DAL972]CBH11199.1 hypothetical protein, unlikely [Trypanosoma brucei gambiense DAL972]|eukprot:XP_011773486.1 hypothetical protein, unlikely [Trypanosoma brucei gambiense DAL972]